MELLRNGLKLIIVQGLDDSEGSVNVPVKLDHNSNDQYVNFTEQVHIRYINGGKAFEEILPSKDSEFYIPGKVFIESGPIQLAVHLINGEVERVTNELHFVVKTAPNGKTLVDPSEFSWQQLVDQYVNAKLETFADKADMNKFKDDVNANLSNQDKKITDLQTSTKIKLDSQDTKINDFKAEVNTSLSNQTTSINHTTSVQNSKITTLEGRMDTFTRLSEGSTTGDAELKDIRVGANGITYNNAGDAVRGQYSQLKEDLDKLKWQSFDMKEYCTNHTVILINGRYAEKNDNFRTSNPIKVSAGDTFVIYNGIGGFDELAKLALYDDKTTQTCKEYVSFTSYDSIYTASSNGYIRFSMYANDKNAYLYKVNSIDGFSKELSNELDRVNKISNSTTLSFNVSKSIATTSNKIKTDIKKGETFYIKLGCDIESINNYQIWINDSFYTSSSDKNDWMTFTATKDIKTIHIVASENNVLKDTTATLFVADKYSLIQLENVSKNTFDIGKHSKVFRVYTNEYDFTKYGLLNNLGLKNGDTIYVMIKSSSQSFGALQIRGNGDYLFSISKINTFVKHKLKKDIDKIGIYIGKEYISEPFTGELIVLANISKDIKHLNDEVQIMTKGEPFLNAYYTDEWKNNVISEINTSNEFINGVSFAFITDLHFEFNSKQSKYLLRYILNNTQVPFVICGGDFPSAYGDSNSLRESAKILNEYQEYIGKNKFFCVRGNHDFTIKDNESSLTGTTLPSYFTYGNLIKNNEYVVSDILPNRMCYYIDNVGQRTRFVMVNSCDTQSEDATAPWGVNYSVSDEQIRWIVNNALNVDGYKIIFIMHIPFDIEAGNDGGTSQIEIGRIAQAINNKTVYTKGNITKDFSNTENEVICVISGHTHRDSSHIDNNVLSIGTTCDAYYTDDGHGAIRNTVTEQAFDIFSINYDTRKIKATRVGRGNSREWTY